jgi:hypothetical protein
MGNAEEVTVKMRKHRQIKTQGTERQRIGMGYGQKNGRGERFEVLSVGIQVLWDVRLSHWLSS